jgi:hypothetical protein
MGASVVEQTWTGRDPQPWTRLPREQRDLNADFIVYEHKSRHQTGDGDLFFMEMYGDGLFTIDSQGWGPHHSSMGSRPEMPEIDGAHATEFCETLSRRFLSDGRSKHPQPPLHAVPSSFKPYIFVPLQLSIDDTIIYDSPYAVREFVGLVCRWAVRSRRRIVFKPHPFCDDGTLLRSIDDYAKRWVWVFRSSANVHNLIAGSDGLILINSGVGFESLIHGKPVVTFGDCDYQWVTFRGHGANLDAASRYIDTYGAAQRREGYRFAYFYHRRHAIDLNHGGRDGAARRVRECLETLVDGRGAKPANRGRAPER